MKGHIPYLLPKRHTSKKKKIFSEKGLTFGRLVRKQMRGYTLHQFSDGQQPEKIKIFLNRVAKWPIS